VTIGYIREDGDLRILATHSNIDEELSAEAFAELVGNTVALYEREYDENIIVLQREDTPDYCDLGSDDRIEYTGHLD
jgi:hypothetical protein